MICSLKLKVRAAFPEKLFLKNTNGYFRLFWRLCTRYSNFNLCNRVEGTGSSLSENVVNN